MTLTPITTLDSNGIALQPLPDVVGFTLRDAASYESILSTIRVWIRDELVPYLQDHSAQAVFQANVDTVIDTVNTNLLAAVHDVVTGSIPVTDAAVAAALGISGSASRKFLDTHYGAGVHPESYVQDIDNGDWALAIARALAAATPVGGFVVLSQMYSVKSPITLATNDKLVGQGHMTGIVGPVNAPIQMLAGTNVTGVELRNFTVDGNCLTNPTKNYTRAVQFIGCSRIRLHGMRTQYTPDWATTFDTCSNIIITDHSHELGRSTLKGGQDGIHLMDTNDAVIDGARIHSGDDCIGITSKKRNISNIIVRNVSGVSEIAAVVTLGNEGTTSFNATGITIENIETFNSLYWDGSYSQYIVKLRAQNSAKVNDVTINNIHGISWTYGVWLDGNSANADSFYEVSLSNIRAISASTHGVHLVRVTNFVASNVYGEGHGTGYCGINVATAVNGTFQGGGARNSGLWGVQLNGCTAVDLSQLNVRENGGASFPSNNGGNLRVVNCTDCRIFGGRYVGAATTSYYGLSTGGNTNVDMLALPPVFGGSR